MAQDDFDPKASSRQSPTTAVRSLRARIGAHALHAKHDSRKLTAPGRRAAAEKLNQRLLAEIDPRNELPESERARRLEHARKAYFSRLRLQQVKNRGNRDGGHA